MSKTQSIRLIALPLSRHNHSLVYLYAQRLPSPAHHAHHQSPPGASASAPPRASRTMLIIKKATDAGAKQWNKLGDAPAGSWKAKIYGFGESMMDRIPYEEWALKTIDPAVVPSPLELLKTGGPRLSSQESASQRIRLLYPRSLCAERALLSWLERSMAEREPYHRKWTKLNLFLSPLTLPFAAVPVIPNLPFFYMIWRAWSHWRAFKASQYLNQVIKHNHLLPVPSPILDNLYASGARPDPTNNQSQESLRSRLPPHTTTADDEVILTREMVLRLTEQLDLPPDSVTEICRGIEQARQRLESATAKPNGPPKV